MAVDYHLHLMVPAGSQLDPNHAKAVGVVTSEVLPRVGEIIDVGANPGHGGSKEDHYEVTEVRHFVGKHPQSHGSPDVWVYALLVS